MTPPQAPSTRELARRLTASAASESRAGMNPAIAEYVACERLYRGLSLWVGGHGAHALFTRAFAQTRDKHPAIREIRFPARADGRLEGVAENIQRHGERAVSAGLEAVLVGVLDLLERLLGPEVAARLVEQGAPDDAGDDEIAS